MRSLLGVLVLAVGLAGVQEPKPEEAAAKDKELLQGTWELEQLELGGAKVALDKLKADTIPRVVIEGSNLTLVANPARDAKAAKKGTFTLDATKAPRAIDVADDKKATQLGIYELKDDALKLCMGRVGGERPKEFKSTAMPETTLLVLKRAKAKKDGEPKKDSEPKKDGEPKKD